MGQGVALGGSWDGLASLLALNAPKEKRGWYAMIPQLGAPFGLIVASLLFAFLISALPAEDFLQWGWRYPFFVAFAINVVALFARLRIVVTPEYTELFESQTLQPVSVLQTIRSEWRIIVLGAFAPLASFAMFHMVTVYPLSWVFLFTEESPVRFLLIEAVAAALGVLAILASGKLADAYGRRTCWARLPSPSRRSAALRRSCSMPAASARRCSCSAASSCWVSPSASHPARCRRSSRSSTATPALR